MLTNLILSIVSKKKPLSLVASLLIDLNEFLASSPLGASKRKARDAADGTGEAQAQPAHGAEGDPCPLCPSGKIRKKFSRKHRQPFAHLSILMWALGHQAPSQQGTVGPTFGSGKEPESNNLESHHTSLVRRLARQGRRLAIEHALRLRKCSSEGKYLQHSDDQPP